MEAVKGKVGKFATEATWIDVALEVAEAPSAVATEVLE